MKGRLDFVFRHPAEGQAWQYLANQDHQLLRHNFHVRFCELDLITIDAEQVLHCIEIKSWKSASLVHPLESISCNKQRKIRRAMQLFVQSATSDKGIIQILLQSGCDSLIQDLSISFDLLWCKNDVFEWHQALF